MEELPQAALGAALRELRKERGLSQDEFAKKSGLHRTFISQTERGVRNVSLASIVRLARALEVDASHLVARAGL
jgi:transcriptional regulator with XRE-family HTH domain